MACETPRSGTKICGSGMCHTYSFDRIGVRRDGLLQSRIQRLGVGSLVQAGEPRFKKGQSTILWYLTGKATCHIVLFSYHPMQYGKGELGRRSQEAPRAASAISLQI